MRGVYSYSLRVAVGQPVLAALIAARAAIGAPQIVARPRTRLNTWLPVGDWCASPSQWRLVMAKKPTEARRKLVEFDAQT
jgi:hypothetical protein